MPGRRSVRDDDPTTIMNRLTPGDLAHHPSLPTLEEARPYPERADRPMNTEERIMATAKATAARAGNDASGLREPLRLTRDSRPGPGSHSHTSVSTRGAGRAVLWVLVVLLALTAGAAGAYLLLIGL
jgi:hypothetical protein